MDGLRAIPSVDRLLTALGPQGIPRPLVVSIVRAHLDEVRTREVVPDEDTLLGELREAMRRRRSKRLQPVINGTGIVIHTNLGRAPLAGAVARAVADLAAKYTNLEFDLESGERGGRAAYVEEILALLCESESATAVNNCAAALVLILRQFARSKPEVIISRGELVQIGGGFRIPEILETSGATLREVGTTNRTTARDYAEAISDRTGLILKVHQSNFRMSGFVESATVAELGSIAKERGIPLAVDLGSGAIVRTERIAGLEEHEPTPAEVLREGADLVCFSGDKLFGGPQSGMIAGRRALIQQVKGHPLFRAFRCDKLILGALQASLELCLGAGDFPALPVIQMLRAPLEDLRQRADRLVAGLQGAKGVLRVVESRAETGGGALPERSLDSIAIEILPKNKKVNEFAREVRLGTPPVIGYISDGAFRVDLRTVPAEQDAELAGVLKVALEIRTRIPSPL